MGKMEKYLPYALLGIGGAAALWYFTQQQPTPATGVPRAVAANGQPYAPTPTVSSVGGSYIGLGTIGGTVNALRDMANQQGVPYADQVVRSIRPQDVGLNNWNHTSAATNSYEAWINTTIADVTFMGIEGVSYSGTSFSQAQFNAGARTSGFWNLNQIAGLENQMQIMMTPIIVEQNQPLTVTVNANTQPATEAIVLIGSIVEKRGMVIA
jgi:hypothetical protein